MARKLKEAANATTLVEAMPVEVGQTALASGRRRWKPFEGTDKLPPAEYKERVRQLKMADGSHVGVKETQFVRAGEARYKVSHAGELIKVYMKRGGVGTKMVWQFKQKYSDTAEGKERARHDKKLRQELRDCGVPGA